MRPPRRASGDEVLLFIGNIHERLSVVGLDEQEYYQMPEASATVGIACGAIYEAILGHCALKAKAKVIYTWKTKDFLRQLPAAVDRVKTPARHGIVRWPVAYEPAGLLSRALNG